MRRLAPPVLALGGLGGWWGKEFDDCGGGTNLVYRHGQLLRVYPIQTAIIRSRIDGQDSLAVRYARELPFPWPWVVDELRWLEPGCLLGMTYVDRASLHRLAFPFLLHKQA